jgi:toxin ParE1/3/4
VSRSLVIRAQALDEITAAAEWYQERSGLLAVEFIEAVDAAIDRIRRAPLQSAVVEGDLRHGVLRRFPYRLLFRCSDEEIVLVGLAHWRQNPRRWHHRR